MKEEEIGIQATYAGAQKMNSIIRPLLSQVNFINFLLFRKVFSDSKFDSIKSDCITSSFCVTAVILFMGLFVIMAILFTGNYSLANILNVVAGIMFALVLEKELLTAHFTRKLKNISKE